jgi:hypothetical protein
MPNFDVDLKGKEDSKISIQNANFRLSCENIRGRGNCNLPHNYNDAEFIVPDWGIWSTLAWGCPTTAHCNENPIYVFRFSELRGLSLNFHIHVSLGNLGNSHDRSTYIFPAGE